MKRRILVTGGAGFIGSHLVRRLVNNYPDYLIVNFDALTYCGNPANLRDVENAPNYRFVHGNICDAGAVEKAFADFDIDGVINLAAESHVDRSIKDPLAFVRSNVMGTLTLLEAARKAWGDRKDVRFHQVSTDEVYGSLKPDGGFFTEETRYDPHSPYSASKASADHFVRAYHDTYGLPTVITNCSNNYGPYQFPEKLIPLFLNNIVERRPLPVYGEGLNVRDWLYVEDHAAALDLVFHRAADGSTYNIGGHNEWRNIDIVNLLIETADRKLGRPAGADRDLITYVTDRKGHDLRYAIDASKLERDLGWAPSVQFEEGLDRTVDWYLTHQEWINDITSGAYRDYYEKMYGKKY